MAGKKDKDDKKVIPLKSKQPKPKLVAMKIEDLARRFKVKPHILAGLKVFCGWPDDARVSEAEFEKKLTAFQKAPINAKPLK